MSAVKEAAKTGLGLVAMKLLGPYLIVGALIAALIVGIMFFMVGASGQNNRTGSSCSAPNSNTVGVATGGFNAAQLSNTKAIVGAAKDVGLDGKAARIGVIAAVGESDLTVIDHGDAAGPDSRGLFQQRANGAWGSYSDRMNPTISATNFFKALMKVAGWPALSETEAIHRVQINADPNHYAKFVSRGDAAIKAAGVSIDFTGTKANTEQVNSNNDDCGNGAVLAGSGNARDDYPFKSKTPGPGVYVVDPFGYYYGECTSWASWAFNRDHGGYTGTGTPKYSFAAGNFANGDGGSWKNGWLSRGWPVSQTPKRGAVAWWGPNGGPGIGPSGHVAYVEDVLPNGKVLLSEYNNSGLAPPGHKFSSRIVDPDEVNGYLLAPSSKP